MSDVLAIIPARGGSKGIPRKNLALCAGIPLVDWTIRAAEDSGTITSALLSSDDDEILARARWDKVIPLRRPDELARDETTTEAVIEHALGCVLEPPEIIVLLQPTSPLRTAAQIDEAVRCFMVAQLDSMVSVSPSHAYLWDEDGHPLYTERKRRQEMWWQYEENGAIYVFTLEHWKRTGNRLGGDVSLYVMGEEDRLQIDTPLDLEIASMLMTRRAVTA